MVIRGNALHLLGDRGAADIVLAMFGHKAEKVTPGTPISDDPGIPVEVGVVSKEPGKPQNHRHSMLVQHVEPDVFHVNPGQAHLNRCGVMGDSAQSMPIQGAHWHGVGQGLPLHSQLMMFALALESASVASSWVSWAESLEVPSCMSFTVKFPLSHKQVGQ